MELDYSRGRFVLECRAAIKPADAPDTFFDSKGAATTLTRRASSRHAPGRA